jgi:hypothetical protein
MLARVLDHNPRPGRLERPILPPPIRPNALDRKSGTRKANPLVKAGVTVAGAEGKPDNADIEHHEGGKRPGANGTKQNAAYDAL